MKLRVILYVFLLKCTKLGVGDFKAKKANIERYLLKGWWLQVGQTNMVGQGGGGGWWREGENQRMALLSSFPTRNTSTMGFKVKITIVNSPIFFGL